LTAPYAIHWFRRDLRIQGNPALQRAHGLAQGRVLGFFCFDPIFLARSDFSANRFQFFLETLAALRDDLRRSGSELLVVDEGPDRAFERLFATLGAPDTGSAGRPRWVSFNRDYEPFAKARDERLRRYFAREGVDVVEDRDHLLVEPEEIAKPGTTEGYAVYSPFARRWHELFNDVGDARVRRRVDQQRPGLRLLEAGRVPEGSFRLTWKEALRSSAPVDVLDAYRERNRARVTVPIPKAGAAAAHAKLEEFAPKVDRYGELRDVPGVAGTSQLSIYLKNGSLAVSQIVAKLDLEPVESRKRTSRGRFFSELVWREFYYHVLGRHPRVETEPFLRQYAALPWENREDYFAAWCEGRTGYPIVDAAMRQLNATGWMHNRARMIVASFLTKDLLVDYRWGERYFMEKLLDGDLAPNNGGWQWAASTGCDPQPYFRIFNPELQGRKFDPEGAYVRRWVPELDAVPASHLHAPPDELRGRYPKPIVSHAEQRDRALALFRSVDPKREKA
jgi:deoxyribodipyrimidine photo-lyase